MEYTNLPPDTDEPVVQHLISIIVQAIAPEKIFLVSKYAECIFTEHICNTPHHPFLQDISYELAVVAAAGEKRTEAELQDIIENRCQATAPVTALIFPEPKFRQLMEAGHPYIQKLLTKAGLLHDAGNIPLHMPPGPGSYTHAGRKDELQQRLKFARSCQEGVSFYLNLHQLTMAAFLLHQAAEHLYTAMLFAATGYRLQTHNLDKLLRSTRCFSIELILLFPRNTPEEAHLFQLLQKAYVDARYKTDYHITEPELQVLAGRVAKMMNIVQEECNSRLETIT